MIALALQDVVVTGAVLKTVKLILVYHLVQELIFKIKESQMIINALYAQKDAQAVLDLIIMIVLVV